MISILTHVVDQIRVHQLPLGERKIRVLSLNPASTNSIVTNYYQGESTTPRDTAIVEVLMVSVCAQATQGLGCIGKAVHRRSHEPIMTIYYCTYISHTYRSHFCSGLDVYSK